MVAEIFLAAFLQALFERLMSPDLLQFALQEGLHLTFKKWERTLQVIDSVLSDAEEKQLTDKGVKMWLDDLRDLAYDVDDILDEFATRALTGKVRGAFSVNNILSGTSWSPSAIKFNFSMGSKIRKITSRLEEFCKQGDVFGLKMIVGKASSSSTAAAAAVLYQRPPTTCLPTEFAVYGRDEEKAKVLEMLLKDEPNDSNFGVVSIVGMGGLGKTTLAREVYNDEAVKDFEPKAWVCVSDDFDVLKISKAILETITCRSCDLKDLNPVQLQLKDALVGRKFLLVLDDVWNKKYTLWKALASPFMVGAPGSKVIVTTRSVDIAVMMQTSGYYNLKLLSDDDCWSLFTKHAFQTRDINAHRNLKLIRDRVVKRCRGLPLAATILGGLLCSKQRDDEWEDILNSGIWDLSDETDVLSKEIFPVLQISYHHLPSHLKRCFAFCAILPKDHEFYKKDLVLLWMAEGLIQKRKDNKQLGDLGGEYFDELLSRSIFQQSINNETKYIMHDLVNDLAQWVSGKTCFRLEEKEGENKQLEVCEKVRHFSFESTFYDGKEKFEVLHKFKHLRTFLAIPPSNWYIGAFGISVMVVSDLLSKFKRLRSLSLVNYHIVELPDSIGRLIHLRYLNLSQTKIRSLPECISLLFNLQTLILSYCYRLAQLPSKMENMFNLQHLDIRDTNLIREMPLGIKELKDLQTLSNFIAGKDGAGCALQDLKKLKFLQGELHISRLENVVGAQDTREAVLSDKKGLKGLQLEWGSEFDDSCNTMEEENVLEMLQPHTNLRSLKIKCYGGTRFPYWLGDASFSNMTVLRLERCENCTSLPSLGLLSSLKDLTIIGMKRLKCLGFEFYGEDCLMSFQSLEILRFEDLQEWECWDKNQHVEAFPCLHELSIKKCPKLSGELPDHLPLLGKLVISECAQLVVSLSSFPVLCKLFVKGCKRIVYSLIDSLLLNSTTLSHISEFENWSMQRFHKVEILEIVGCDELIDIWQNEISLEKTPKGSPAFNTIRKLCIRDCPNLVQFPEICFLPFLTELRIVNCYALMSLPEGMKLSNLHLQHLEIDGNNLLSFVTRGRLPSSLQRLWLIRCEKLQYVFADADATETTLKSLYIDGCSEIATLSRGLLPDSLQELEIRNCPKLESITERFHKRMLLETMTISHCENFESITEGIHKLGHVCEVRIDRCSKITTLSRGQLPDSLQQLHVCNCAKVESIAERFQNSILLEKIWIEDCESFETIPEGIHKLSRLCEIGIYRCPSLVCFPEGGLPNNNLRVFDISDCKNLKGLPRGMQNLNTLSIWKCPSIKSFPEKCFPTNLTTLVIGDLYMYERLSQLGLHKLTSLTSLQFHGLDVVSLEIGIMLPTCLAYLTISDFPKLKYLSSDDFQNLTSLVVLSIRDCPKLVSFPKIGLPSSLMQLIIYKCPMLQKRCKRDKGQEWPKIAHIPRVEVDYYLI